MLFEPPQNTASTPVVGAISAQPQPWRAVWPAKEQPTLTSQQSVLYGYQKGAKMMTQGSAGEMNMSIVYDTGSR